MSKLEVFDINDLIIQLHDELKLAFHISQLDQLEGNLRLHSVKARLGRKLVADEPDAPVPTSLLYGERYPNEEDWEIEVSYKSDRALHPQTTDSGREVQEYILLDKLAGYPVSTLKGVSTHWERVLSKEGIQTVGELARIPYEEIMQLTDAYNAYSLLDFYAKVSLLKRQFVILSYPEFGETPFRDMVLKSETELKRAFDNKLSLIEISELKLISSLLLVVFDKKAFERFSLKLLFD